MDFWQGIEVEYAVPFDEGGGAGGSGASPRRLLQALAAHRFADGRPALLTSAQGNSAFLANGGKVYVDHVIAFDLLEFSSPECADARQMVAYERACDAYVALASDALAGREGRRVHCYKTSVAYGSNGEPTTRGLHESYLLSRRSWERCIAALLPYLAIRQLFCGAGGYYQGRYAVSPRQFFIRQALSKDVPRDRPFIASGKESHTSADYVRLHLCNGEGTRAEMASYLRQWVTGCVVASVEAGTLARVPPLKDPIAAAQQLSADPDGQDWTVELSDRSRVDAVEYLRAHYLPPIARLLEQHGAGERDRLALETFTRTLDALAARDFAALERSLDWVIKRDLLERNLDDYFDIDGEPTAEVKQGLDFQYKAVTDSLFAELEAELGFERLTRDGEVEAATQDPPAGSRAALRVALASQVAIDEMDWDRVVVGGRRMLLSSLKGWDDEAIAAMVAEARLVGAGEQP